MRNSALHVGRIGGLAVALGIGTAVATGHGLALADTTDGAGPASNDTSQSNSESPDAGPKAASVASAAPGQNAGSGSSPSADSERDELARSGIVQSSGGAHTSSNPPTGVDTIPDDRSGVVSTIEGSVSGPVDTGPPTSGEDTGPPATGQPAVDQSGSSLPNWRSARHSMTTSLRSSQADTKPAPDVDAAALPTGNSGATNGAGRAAIDATITTADAKGKAVELKPVLTTVETLSAANSQPMDQDATAPQPTISAPAIVAGLLGALGFSPLATTDPLPPTAPPPTLFALLEWVRREINRTFFNQTPTIAYDPAQNSLVDGSIVGKFTAVDADTASHTFTATKPAHGEVTVDADGNFTYTPDASFKGPDSFQVTVTEVDDGGMHIHGLPGLLNLVTFGLLGDSGHASTQTITFGAYTASTVVSGLDQPTDFRLLPDGRIVFAEKGGAIRVAGTDGQLQDTPLITLPASTDWARGVAAIELDPDYEENGHIYVSYIRSDNYQRLSRLTVTDPSAAVLTVDPASEKVLVQGTQPAGDDHHGGGLAFGPDGKLYWSVGDNVCCSVIDGSNSQDLTNMYGKVLRLNPDGTAPADNPFYDGDGSNYDAIYATGFRNPFRLAFTPDGQLLVVDVGQATWEELNLVTAGGNYGWPGAEGPCDGIGTANCSTPSSYDDPIYAYRHSFGGNSITAVMVNAGVNSGGGQNTVLIADFNQGWVKELTFNSDYSSLISERMFGSAATGNTNQLRQDADGNIYQLTFDGTLTRIALESDVSSTV
ncbi:MAG: aldose sugar dehydrogenase [Pseudonocardiales bacterium]|nr:aldose sugar dehydrogenase [Pseudonocardiales bacterium]